MWFFSKIEQETPFGRMRACRIKACDNVTIYFEDSWFEFHYDTVRNAHMVVWNDSPRFALYIVDGAILLRYGFEDFGITNGEIAVENMPEDTRRLVRMAWWLMVTPNKFRQFAMQLGGYSLKKTRCVAK